MKRHAFICPRCGEPTRELRDVYCWPCAEAIERQEEPRAHMSHLANEIAVPVIGHPGTV